MDIRYLFLDQLYLLLLLVVAVVVQDQDPLPLLQDRVDLVVVELVNLDLNHLGQLLEVLDMLLDKIEPQQLTEVEQEVILLVVAVVVH